MTDKDVYLAASGCSAVRHIDTDASYGKFSSSAIVECDATTLTMGDAITIDAGYTDQHQNIFEGYVAKIEYLRPDNLIRLTCYDRLILAANYFIVADDPEAPFQRNNILSFDLIKDLLALASPLLTTDIYDDTSLTFTWGTNDDGARFNLQSVADACNFIAQTTGNILYCGPSGHIHFSPRKPYAEAGDTSTHSFTSGSVSPNIIDIQYSAATDKTRNVVKIFGKTPLSAQASAPNSYLVVDQTMVVASDMLDTDELCQGAADVNLELLNHLTESLDLTVIGDPSVRVLGIADVTDDFIGFSARKVFLYKVAHNIDQKSGYYLSITAVPIPLPIV